MNSDKINSQRIKCYFGDGFSEQAKSSLQEKVCKNLPVEFQKNGKSYCVLHFPDKSKHENTNFIEIIKDRLDKQEYDFYGVYFSGRTDYFSKHIFSVEADFEKTTFDDADFSNSTFTEKAHFSFSTLTRANFQGTVFDKISFFIQTIFASKEYQFENHLCINFSKASFFDATFQDCIFHKLVHFNETVFKEVGFLRTTFENGAGFHSAKFNEAVHFDDAILRGTTTFSHTIFDCDERAKDFTKKKSFVITGSFRNVNFQDVRFWNCELEATIFDNCEIDKIQIWESNFNSYAGFESANFKNFDFFKVNFKYEANFRKANFQGETIFKECFFSDLAEFSKTVFLKKLICYKTTFDNEVNFNESIFGENSHIIFQATIFRHLVTFYQAIIRGSVSLDSNEWTGDGETIMTSSFCFESINSRLSFKETVIEKAVKISMHSVRLQPNWFINTDARNYSFTDCIWTDTNLQPVTIKGELESLRKRAASNPNTLLIIAFRQLAENYESTNDLKLASDFRQMAFETEWIDKKEKILNWIKNLVPENEKIKRRFANLILGKSNEKEDEPNPPTNSFGILRRSGDFFIHGLYRITSFYGESWSWAAFVLALIIFAIFPLIYTQIEFQVAPKTIPLQVVVKDCPDVTDELKSVCKIENRGLYWSEAIPHSLATASFQTVEYRIPKTTWGSVWMILEKIFAPLQAALLALAIRRKFMR